MKRTALILAAFVYCMTYAPAAWCAEPAKPANGVMKGQVAPDFALKDITGKQIALSSVKNNVVCLQFWATWCPYCIKEVPRFKELHAKFAAKGLKILAINIAANDPMPRVEAYQQKAQLPYPILYDATQEVSRMFYVTGVPVSIIIDRKGVIQHRGYQLPENAEQLISQLL
jgi:peroxiredoxin